MNPIAPETAVDQERQTIRLQNSVRLVTKQEDGRPLERLPDGIFGFTYSPASDAIPLFVRHAKASFEVHKPASGPYQILGYLAPSQVEARAQDVKLYPDAFGEATKLVAIASDRIGRLKGPSRAGGNYL
ncbi:MAG: hypothetical protein ABI693_23990, partial [Bryobacteraceae bacterium]